MDPATWTRVETHFQHLEKLPREQQDMFLKKLAAEDRALAEVLQQLLQEEEDLHPIFSKSGTQLMDSWQEKDRLNQQIGPYKLIKHLGSGAMASVYLGQRADGQFDQLVAIKLINGITNDPYFLDLFKRERQTLASLQHPGIARLYDGGMTEDGIPYFTMEYIDGVPVTSYCEQNNLSLRHRIKLLRQICEAVNYAHHKLVAHLDLKPANILVDRDGRVKVLDFGIARIMEPIGIEKEKKSAQNERFTLAYAAPEQINGGEINAAADIYALGVITYELLNRRHPYQEQLQDPLKLKTSILAGEKVPNQVDLERISQADRKELAAIWSTARHTFPDQRYLSTGALLRDLIAFEDKKPLSVIAPEGTYLFRKFIQRHYKMVSAISLSLVLLAFTVIFYTIQVRQQRNIALTEAEKAAKVTAFLSEIFKLADPFEVNGDTITAVHLLEEGLRKIDASLKNQPAVKASLLHELVNIYTGLGRYQLADSLGQVALHITDSLYRKPHSEKARSLFELGRVATINFEFELALDRFQKSYQIHRQLNTTEPGVFSSLHEEMANVYLQQENLDLADSLYHLVYEYHSNSLDSIHPDIADDLHYIGTVKRLKGELDTAESYYLKSYRMKQKLYDPPHQQLAYTLNHLSSLKQNQGLYEAAIPYAKESFEQRKKILGDHHLETIASQSNLARIFTRLEKDSASLELYHDAHRKLEDLFPQGHFYVGAIMQNIVEIYIRQENLMLAEQYATEAYQMDLRIVPEHEVYRARNLLALGKIWVLKNKFLPEAEKLLLAAQTILTQNLDEEHKFVVDSKDYLKKCRLALQNAGQGEIHLSKERL